MNWHSFIDKPAIISIHLHNNNILTLKLYFTAHTYHSQSFKTCSLKNPKQSISKLSLTLYKTTKQLIIISSHLVIK